MITKSNILYKILSLQNTRLLLKIATFLRNREIFAKFNQKNVEMFLKITKKNNGLLFIEMFFFFSLYCQNSESERCSSVFIQFWPYFDKDHKDDILNR